MPRRRTSIKSQRADSKRHLRNLQIKKELKKVLKKFNSLAAAKNIEEAKKLLSTVFSKLDKAAKKNVIHKSMASRKKSRLMQRVSKSA